MAEASLAPSELSFDRSEGGVEVMELVREAAATLVATVECEARTLLRSLSSCCCSTDKLADEEFDGVSDDALGLVLTSWLSGMVIAASFISFGVWSICAAVSSRSSCA